MVSQRHLALIVGGMGSFCAAWVINFISCSGECEPAQGVGVASEMPLIGVYLLITLGVVIPVSTTIRIPSHLALRAAFTSIGFAVVPTWLFYAPETDTARGLAMLFLFFAVPWFIGCLMTGRMWPNDSLQARRS